MSHAVADCFQITGRGYIREGYFADLVIVNLNEQTTIKSKIFYINAAGARWRTLLSEHHYTYFCKRPFGLWKRQL